MRNAQRNDIVTCERAGLGDFRVIAIRDQGVSVEVLIQNVSRPMQTVWMYEHHCTKNIKKTLESRIDAANKILAIPNRKQYAGVRRG